MRSCIKYFGGKGNGLGFEIYQYFPAKDQYDVYIEAFGGAGNLLLIKEPFGIEVYNDLEKNVYSLFKVISNKDLFFKFKELCDLSIYSRFLRDEYKENLKKEDMELVERAYKYFYVNRTSRNGIGGFARTMECVRRNMSKSVSDFLSSIDGLYEMHNRLSRVIVENLDAIELIKDSDRDRTFIYADSPYSQDVRSGTRYKVDMDNKQQKKYIDTLINMKKAKVLVSGYECELYELLCKNGWTKINIKVNTVDGNGKPKTKIESLWKNYGSCPDEKYNLWS